MVLKPKGGARAFNGLLVSPRHFAVFRLIAKNAYLNIACILCYIPPFAPRIWLVFCPLAGALMGAHSVPKKLRHLLRCELCHIAPYAR